MRVAGSMRENPRREWPAARSTPTPRCLDRRMVPHVRRPRDAPRKRSLPGRSRPQSRFPRRPQQLGRRRARCGVHPHVQRVFTLEAESAPCRLELERGRRRPAPVDCTRPRWSGLPRLPNPVHEIRRSRHLSVSRQSPAAEDPDRNQSPARRRLRGSLSHDAEPTVQSTNTHPALARNASTRHEVREPASACQVPIRTARVHRRL